MSLHRGAGRSCRICGKPLTDPTSRMFGIGPDCRSDLSPAQLRASLEARKQEDDPFHLPEHGPASLQARINNANARAAGDPEQVQLCRHENQVGRCGDCRREADPARAAEMILRAIRAESYAQRRAERIAVQAARRDRGIPTPVRRPAVKPARRQRAARAQALQPAQMELL